MSVVELLNSREVCGLLDSVMPPLEHRITVPMIAPPVTNHYPLVGTAFDYAIRFELQRRYPYPYVCAKPWVSESAVNLINARLRRHVNKILGAAKADFQRYITCRTPDKTARRAMAAHAIRLAKIDAIYRAGFVDPTMDVADPGDVRDVLQLLSKVPYGTLSLRE